GRGHRDAAPSRAARRVGAARGRLGARLRDVVRTRMYVTNIDDWQQVGRAHGEVFKDVRPAATMVEVRRLVSPEMLVEIEADAVVEEVGPPPTALQAEQTKP